MDREYYDIKYCLDGKTGYLIWYTGDTDGVVVDVDLKVVSFVSLEDLRVYCKSRGIPVAEGSSTVYDLDVPQAWLKCPNKHSIDCAAFISAWNLFTDILTSLRGSLTWIDDKKQMKIYDKLFWGNNLPAMTPEGECYVPVWTDGEVERMKKVLADGLAVFRQSVVVAEIPPKSNTNHQGVSN